MVNQRVSDSSRKQFRAVIEASRNERAAVRDMIAKGKWTRADPDVHRSREFLMRIYSRRGKEALQGLANDLQPIRFMTEGAAIRRAVGKVVVDTDSYHEEGSGFLISPELFITNQHVLEDENAVRQAFVIFDYEYDDNEIPRKVARFCLDPKRFALFSSEYGGLDYALVSLGKCIEGNASVEDLGFCPISDTPDRHILGMNVNIIQHPHGQRKQVALRNNRLTYRSPKTLLYETDTEVGSSGSPVFNDDWDIVALHHYGEPFTERVDERGIEFPVELNEGIRISAIHDDLLQRKPGLSLEQQNLLGKALSLSTAQTPAYKLPQLERRYSHVNEIEVEGKEAAMKVDEGEMKIAIPVGKAPVEVSIRVSGNVDSGIIMKEKLLTATATPTRQLKTAAEGKRLDKNYSNRNGFDPKFIHDVPINLENLLAPLKNRIAPLKDGEANGELKYQNFSVIMDKQRQFALLTATNIDGDSYRSVDRKSGEVHDDEGETWYKDNRISEEHYVTQSFYSEWSHKFDRGHLTRRNDPTWGTDKEAERANADTFHFTNCTPQHFRFNQSSQYWQGIERYVLEQGVLKADRAKHLTVLQGPLLIDRDDLWADDVQIPSAFWKVVVWNGASGPRAVGMIAYQSDLLDEDRVNIRRSSEDEQVEVRQYHCPISQIAKLTKLDLESLQEIDTFKKGLPAAGEAAVRITKWADLRL